jgi:ribulose-phosphate 3-epimerase
MCPSILNANRHNLAFEIDRVTESSDLLHLDVMDNIFVPNITFSFEESAAIIAGTSLPVDAHLMIIDPDEKAVDYARAGAASVTFHYEASMSPRETIDAIKNAGARAGLALKPATPFYLLEDLLSDLDMILIMTVEPGFGGQSFMTEMMPKVESARAALNEIDRDIWLQVDGGISIETISAAAAAGADAFVAGSAVYKAKSPGQMLDTLRKLATANSTFE